MEDIDISKYITSEHGKKLPTVRIHKIAIKNLKNTKEGVVEFACSKKFVPYDTQSDILGIYGQNGSGKTTLIQAIRIAKELLSGEYVDSEYSKLIMIGEEKASIEVVFDFQYPDETIRSVVYSFDITKEKNPSYVESQNFNSDERIPEYFVRVLNEKVEASGVVDGKETRLQAFITYNLEAGYGPSNKLSILFASQKSDVVNKLAVIGNLAYKESKSAIFNKDLFNLLSEKEEQSDYFLILKELMLFADNYLFVVDSLGNGLIRLNFALPVYTEHGAMFINTDRPTFYPKGFFEDAKKEIDSVSLVLSKIIPGLELKIHNPVETKDKKGNDAIMFELYSKRGDIEMPVGYEADGVRKIIMFLKLIVSAFNQKSTTIAIDELDAGVFEYLLGEILELFQEHGKGQFIFTSHNLRPLEVLDKKFICFTTSNPSNRYIRMKGVGHSNNLRLQYFREILLANTQEEVLYENEKKFKILGAFKQCQINSEETDE